MLWNKTRFGKNIFAIGGNPEAAKVSGVNVAVNLVVIYALAGVFYAFGGMLEAGRIGSATNNLGFMYELDAIAACVVGGFVCRRCGNCRGCDHRRTYLHADQLWFDLHRCQPLLAVHHQGRHHHPGGSPGLHEVRQEEVSIGREGRVIPALSLWRTHTMAFKVKINVLLLLAILVTIGTAWFSVNHFISGYIRTQATQNINEQITLVREKLAGDINQKVLLAANLNLGVTSVKKALQETGFHNIVKLIGDMAFDANGVIDDKARVDALRKLIPAANNQITVSPLEQLDGKPVISILVPRGADSAYLYYLDMSEFKTLLTKVSGEGRYFSLTDSQGQVLYSSKPQGRARAAPTSWIFAAASGP